jgi:hypothetical protein
MPQLFMIIPVGGLEPGRPDNSLPGAGWGGPVDPGWGSSGPDRLRQASGSENGSR